MSRRFDNNDDDDNNNNNNKNNNNNNNNNNHCNSNIFVTCCQIAWCWKHVQLQTFAAARSSLIHQTPEGKDL